MAKKIERAIITAAGYGTRFLPFTKDVPKEMLPIVDKPVIQYIVEEIIDAGIEEIVIVIRPGGEAIMRFFTDDMELERFLKENDKAHLLDSFRDIIRKADFIFMHQDQKLPYGNGSPFLTAKSLLKRGPFLACWGDDMVLTPNAPSACKQVVDEYIQREDSHGIIAVQEVPKQEVSRYGVVEYDSNNHDRITRIIEKPDPDSVTSNLVEFGRFVITGEIFEFLSEEKTGKDGELWLIDAIDASLKDHIYYPKKIEGKWVTTGDPLRALKATVQVALGRKDLKDEFVAFLKQVLENNDQ